MIKYIIALCMFANIALAETTTIFTPDGTVTVCTTGKDMIICV
jgi:hypothetical protein